MAIVQVGAADPRSSSSLVQELLRHDDWSRDQLLAHQREQLRSLIDHAVSTSSYYRDVLGTDALAPDIRLQDLPVLSKSTLMEQFDRVVTDRRLRLAAVEAHAAGSDPAAMLAGECHVFSTSGTTGRRGVFPQTRAEFDRWLAAGWRMRLRCGIEPTARAIGIAAPTPLHITHKLFTALGAFGERRPRLTVTAPIAELVETLNRDRPEAIFTVPTIAGMLAAEQLDGRLAIGPRWIVVAGEILAEDTIARVQSAWGIEPFQVYASTEALMLASETPDRAGLHISEDLIVLEVVDESNQPVPPGVPGYKVLVTSFVNRTLPLIRYELGDTVTIAPGPDPSGRPYRRIERVDGRNDDVLRLPAVGGGEVVVLPHRLRAPFARLPDVLQYQIVRAPNRLAVRVVLRPGATSGTLEIVATNVRSALESAGAAPQPIEIEPVAAIEREPGGAKLKLVKTVTDG